jgi:adenylosuccinate synthase
LGITKAYCTRVGAGPFPSELYDHDNPAKQDPIGVRLAEVGKEFGSVTGRPRRTGWLDAAALKRSIQINGLSGLCITKLDVLDGLETIRLCVGYNLDGQKLDVLPRGAESVARCEPIYEDFPGWQGTTFGIREWGKLPKEAQNFLRRIEELAGKPIAMVSTGPERDETILLQHPFQD